MTLRQLRLGDKCYPPLLRAIHDPPSVLWVRGDGDLRVLTKPAVAIVGARSCTAYGRGVARSLGRELAAAGAVVVSGLARGIDGEAHRGALEGSGTTIAVLGCGVDRDYPAAHADLARRIVASGGLIVSEYEPGVEPAPWRFPARNRIIAGLCSVTVVVEARERSGALITTDMALEQGREVMAVPGEITSAPSTGTNNLIRQGAAPVTRVLDVFEALGLEERPAPPAVVDPVHGSVLAALAAGAAVVDDLARTSGLSASAVASALAALELEGRVSAEDGIYRTTISR